MTALRTCVQVGLLVALLAAPAAAQCGGQDGCGGQDEFCCPGDCCKTADLACVPAMGGGSKCVPCGADSQPCCDGECANSGLACVGGTCGTCGGPGLDCCPGSPSCAENSICSGTECIQCGQEAGQPCCDDNSEDECREGLLCSGSLCEACGNIGLQCCANDTCPENGTCINGTCQSSPTQAGGAAPAMSSAGLVLIAILLVGIGAFGVRRRRAV
jgi:hypothetical protein